MVFFCFISMEEEKVIDGKKPISWRILKGNTFSEIRMLIFMVKYLL